jgi:TATA-binding protein-associated factor
LKRKARLNKNKPTARPTDITSSSALKKRKTEEGDSSQVVVAHKDVTQLGVYSSGDEWPFEGLCEQLCMDLFSPQWEVRHGSAIGLRELLQIHGSGVILAYYRQERLSD